MWTTYIPKGVCSRKMEVEIEDGVIQEVHITGGCSGNSQGVVALCKGRKVEEVIDLLKDIQCGIRSTSCPQELAKALQAAIEKASS